jgi:hypothetical protein
LKRPLTFKVQMLPVCLISRSTKSPAPGEFYLRRDTLTAALLLHFDFCQRIRHSGIY